LTAELIDKKELPPKNVVLKELTQEMTYVYLFFFVETINSLILNIFRQCYSKHKRICPGDSYDKGELVAVKSRSQWHRGRFLQYKPGIDFAHVSSHRSAQLNPHESS
jgi:hypothetical protein